MHSRRAATTLTARADVQGLQDAVGHRHGAHRPPHLGREIATSGVSHAHLERILKVMSEEKQTHVGRTSGTSRAHLRHIF
eukprot:1212661-Pleurochrysis_carterae.AAC.5